ncbi:DUF6790 family protein [Pseudochelatococcus sp. G4_1912]|uniref:DUF6790 family protein n=1 Tax=Pseudochelatococcus sp. G4_1912 TaxID=3114288 RepID=UPI0039C67B10
MESTIRFALSNFTLTFFIIGLIASAIRIARAPRPVGIDTIVEALLRYFLLFSIGLAFFYNFIMHVFFGEMSAAFIGWQNSPFQAEVGYASLGFALVALLAVSRGFEMKLAAIAGPACFLWGASIGHIIQIVTKGNFAPGNAGIMLYSDILLPVVGLLLLWLSRKYPLEY